MRILIILFFLIAFFSCGNPPDQFATVNDGLQYISESKNGFVKDTLLSNGVEMKIQLLPASLVQKSNNPGKQKYFSIQFSLKGHELLAQLPREEYGVYVQLFSFGMDRFILLKTDSGKEYPANMVSYQPTYNMGKSNELIVVFNEDLSSCKTLQLVVKEFGLNMGQIEFSIDLAKFNYSPKIEQL
ncbi:hypothetical protein [Sphingobacterium sp. 2149]|uniref:hypothetical protein n=1 Tax=Sphingobacterium sp. 2149 TaxID=2817763 RepID=UPI001AE738F5|nr:hypothetical protein [Sphingobacterium sp. 2149]MDR6735565.1 hypothetical protein [Sphingobacterium sp. 2149]